MIEKQTNFGKISTKLPLPDLLDMQKQSFVDFLQLDVPPAKRELKGLQAAFEDVFPIEAPDGSMRLEFLKYELGSPRYATPAEATVRDSTYSAPLKALMRLYVKQKNGKMKEASDQDVTLCDLPLMTDAGCFVFNGAERFRLFRTAIREIDPTRPVGIGCCHGVAVDTGMFAELDLTGWNYGAQYRKVKAHHPDKPVVYSESASALSSSGFFEQPPASSKTDYAVARREVGSYEHNAAPWSDIPDVEFARMEEDRYCAGEFVWTGIDYLGEPTPYVQDKQFPMMKDLKKSELARSSYFGIADLMGLPKARYWIYRSHWNKKDHTVQITPHWNWPDPASKAGAPATVPVYVYTDGDEAELFLNGTSLGRRRKGVVQRPVNLAAGKPVNASSVERRGERVNAPSHAVDGENGTRWCASGPQKGAWWQVDLGDVRAFRTVLVSGEQADGSYAWTVRVSDDGKTWRDFAKKALGAEQKPVADKTVRARFVRVVFDDLREGTWPSIREVVVSDCAEAFRLNPYYDVCDRYRLRWFDVPYRPGELKAVAYKEGKAIGEAVMRTAGKPVAVKLTAEAPALPDDGKTCVFVQVDVVDAKGTRDPWAKDRVSFELTGPGKILAVGNADPRAHEPFTKVDSHPLYFGKAVAVVRRDKGASGPIVLKAAVKGLKPAEVEFR